ncbi:hypothetical protein HAX54_028024, partial [Datura stramonium]|nr:hypothetical protein [Datura stramonium]
MSLLTLSIRGPPVGFICTKVSFSGVSKQLADAHHVVRRAVRFQLVIISECSRSTDISQCHPKECQVPRIHPFAQFHDPSLQ